MGAIRGSLTFTRFFVIGDVPEDLAGATLPRIRAEAFKPLVAEEDISSRHGWASVEDPYDTDLDHNKVFYNEYVVLAMRIDSWSVPGPLLKAHLADAEEALLKKRGLEKLGRKAKADLKIAVMKQLRKSLIPTTKSIDLVWDQRTGLVRFFSHSPKMHELVQELFEKTFRLQLLVESPGTAVHKLGLHPEHDARFDALEPTTLATNAGETP